jgi:hypothetical protein
MCHETVIRIRLLNCTHFNIDLSELPSACYRKVKAETEHDRLEMRLCACNREVLASNPDSNTFYSKSRDSVVGIATGYGLDD